MSVKTEWQTIVDSFQCCLQLYCCGKAHKLPNESENETRIWIVEKVFENSDGKYRFESICLCSKLEIAIEEAVYHLWGDGFAFEDTCNIFAPRVLKLAEKLAVVDQLTEMQQQLKMAVCCKDCYTQMDGMQSEKWESQNTLCKVIVKPSLPFIDRKRRFQDSDDDSSTTLTD